MRLSVSISASYIGHDCQSHVWLDKKTPVQSFNLSHALNCNFVANNWQPAFMLGILYFLTEKLYAYFHDLLKRGGGELVLKCEFT